MQVLWVPSIISTEPMRRMAKMTRPMRGTAARRRLHHTPSIHQTKVARTAYMTSVGQPRKNLLQLRPSSSGSTPPEGRIQSGTTPAPSENMPRWSRSMPFGNDKNTRITAMAAIRHFTYILYNMFQSPFENMGTLLPNCIFPFLK